MCIILEQQSPLADSPVKYWIQVFIYEISGWSRMPIWNFGHARLFQNTIYSNMISVGRAPMMWQVSSSSMAHLMMSACKILPKSASQPFKHTQKSQPGNHEAAGGDQGSALSALRRLPWQHFFAPPSPLPYPARKSVRIPFKTMSSK